MNRCNLRQHAASLLAVLVLWRCAAGSSGGWTQALPPAVGLGIAGIYVLVDRIAGATIEMRRNHREGMRCLAAHDTAGAVKAFSAAVALHDSTMRPRSKARSRTVSAYQACRRRLAEIEAARTPPGSATQASVQQSGGATGQSAPEEASGAGLQPFESDSGVWGYRETSGRTVITPRFVVAQPFSACGIAAAVDSAGWAIIDTTGAVLRRPFVVDNGPEPYSDGLARFVSDSLIGYHDTCGNVVIEPRFTFAGPFVDGYAPFCEDCRGQSDGEHTTVAGGRWGYVARDGRVAVEAAYEKAEPAAGGLGRVMEKGAWKTVPLPAAPSPQ